MNRLGAALPVAARITPELQTVLREQRGVTIPTICHITWISYASDEGGIICRVETGVDKA